MELQARQTAVPTVTPLGPNPHTGLTSCVSLNTAVAMRVGPHRITYQPNLSGVPDPSGLQLRVDGYLMGPPGPGGIVLGSGGRILPTTAPGGIQVEYPGGTNIVVTPGFWEYHQLWYLNVDVRHARVTQGVIGAIAPNNWLPALPDGTFLGPRPDDLHQRYLDLYEKFADAWRVSDTSSLFDYAPGTSTATFTIDQWPLESPQTCPLPDDGEDGEGPTDKPPLPPLPLEVARQVCSGIVEDERRSDCEQDVMVTGERTFADTYLRTERIQRNRIPAAPVLLSPENDSTGVDLTVRFTWRQTVDKDRGKLRYMHCAWLTREPFTFDKCTTLAQPMEPMDDISFKLWLSFFLAALLLVFVLYVKGKKGDLLLTLLALALLAAIVLLLQLGRGGTMSHTVEGLEPGKAYFWKVVVQDGQGGTVESETRRFATKPN